VELTEGLRQAKGAFKIFVQRQGEGIVPVEDSLNHQQSGLSKDTSEVVTHNGTTQDDTGALRQQLEATKAEMDARLAQQLRLAEEGRDAKLAELQLQIQQHVEAATLAKQRIAEEKEKILAAKAAVEVCSSRTIA
jgi:hypothetical protein